MRVRNGGSGDIHRRGGGGGCGATSRAPGRLRLPQQPARVAGIDAGWLCRGGARRHRKIRGAAHRLVAGHKHLGHSADRTGLPATRPGYRRTPRRFQLSQHAEFFLRRRLRAPLFWSDRSGGRGIVGVLVQRQGVCLGATHDGGGADRRGRRGRRGFAVPDDAVWLQLARPDFRPGMPPIRCTAQRHLDRRSGRLRAAGKRPGTPRCGCRAAARHRRIQRCLSHVIAASGRPGRAHGDAGCAQNGGFEALCNRLYPPARHRHPKQRRGGVQGGSGCIRLGHAVQFHQRRDRPHPGRGRRRGRRHLRAGAATRA